MDRKQDGDEPVWVTHVVMETYHKRAVVAALDWLLSHLVFTLVNKLNTILVPQLQQGTGSAEKNETD